MLQADCSRHGSGLRSWTRRLTIPDAVFITQVDLKRVEYFIQRVGECEDQIFQKRARLLRRQKERRERDKQNGGRGGRGGGRGRCCCHSQMHKMVLMQSSKTSELLGRMSQSLIRPNKSEDFHTFEFYPPMLAEEALSAAPAEHAEQL